ncbi:sporulation YhaL family protein [Bacillus sp. AGMB 02131]|uniref:Sporulation YhaL family protein n=1 Tax=Peribacillus faecalis TaxID=2772559 RepID=A0A927D2B0_9BACI|nr:sporulation YhaL family protein [Peribacillus faecalis]MBD3110250.1 sporulation YhaL family protein [Peribacillus faecalis]
MPSFFIISCLVGIAISAIMVIKTGREESQIENDFIEQEGQKYIERMQEEKARRMRDASEEAG